MNEINSSLYKTIGFMDYDEDFITILKESGYTKRSLDSETKAFLDQAYHSEYLRIMFFEDAKNSITRLYKELDYEIEIINIQTKVKLDSVEIFAFNDPYKEEQIALFSLDYLISNDTLENISNVSDALNRHDTEIIYQNNSIKLKEFISTTLLNDKRFYDGNTSVEQYAGSRFKNYLVIDLESDVENRDDLLFELGTCVKIGTIQENTVNAPSQKYKENILENKVSCFNNYTCLALLDSFTVVGKDNYDSNNQHVHSTWGNVYFSSYIFSLYMKCSLQILSNEFSTNAMNKRKEFQKFYNKYYLNKISFGFLPNEIYKGIVTALDIEGDITFIREKLETLSTQVNEKQQRQQELLLLCISLIALLETPSHLEGIREIIGINNMVMYNSIVYALLVITIISFLIINIRKNK